MICDKKIKLVKFLIDYTVTNLMRIDKISLEKSKEVIT